MLRVTHVITDENVGGAGIQLANLCASLRDSFSPEIILPEGSALRARLPAEGIRITPLPFARADGVCAKDIHMFCAYFRQHRPHIVHTHAALSARIGAMLAGVGLRLSTRHCAKVAPVPLSYPKRVLYNRCTTLTIATARAAADDLLTEGVPQERMITVQNGTPPTRRVGASECDALRRHLDLQKNDTVLGCCARLTHIKGQDLLLRAVAMLRPRYPTLRVLLVGDGDRRTALEALAARLGIRDIVRFAGYTEDPAPYQNLFTLNINPSRGTETSCLATSECMSLGIPTIASDFGGNPDMITQGENGILFRTDDTDALAACIADMLQAPHVLAHMREGARRIYREKFTLDRMANAYKQIYFSLLSNKNLCFLPFQTLPNARTRK